MMIIDSKTYLRMPEYLKNLFVIADNPSREEVRAIFPDSSGQNADLVDAPSERAIFGNSLGKARNFKKRNDTDLSASRFFYVPKTSRADRNEGCESMPLVTGGMVSNTSGQHITRRDDGYVPVPVHNDHPTVKPTELMQYLCRMVTPPGGTVIDPCCGSGSTGKGALIEGFNFLGIDIEQHNIDISTCRLDFILNNLDLFGKFKSPRK